MSVNHIDFNIDVAQGFGIYKNDIESELLDYVSTVNISCGFHAGDPVMIRDYLLKCKEKNLTVSAHIGYNDITGMGYRPMDIRPEETEASVIYQLGALITFAKSYGLVIDSVRPHGALYKAVSENYDIALSVVNAVQKVDKWLNFTCLDNEIADRLEAETNITVNREVFADKFYTPDFKVDSARKDYVREEDVLNRIRTILYSSQIKLGNGIFMPVKCNTLHFDTKNPEILEVLKKAVEIVKPTQPNYNKARLSGWV